MISSGYFLALAHQFKEILVDILDELVAFNVVVLFISCVVI